MSVNTVIHSLPAGSAISLQVLLSNGTCLQWKNSVSCDSLIGRFHCMKMQFFDYCSTFCRKHVRILEIYYFDYFISISGRQLLMVRQER
jgi:hypothetical protein